eukprot:5166990-Prorocentrum_lima.AAC.1
MKITCNACHRSSDAHLTHQVWSPATNNDAMCNSCHTMQTAMSEGSASNTLNECNVWILSA